MSKIKALRIIAIAKSIVCDTDEYKQFAATHTEHEAKSFMWDTVQALILDLKNHR